VHGAARAPRDEVAGAAGIVRQRLAAPVGVAGAQGLDLLSTVGAFAFAAGVLLCLADLWRTVRRPEREHGNPWRAGTLEWLPSREYGMRSIPQVGSREPLWDHANLASQVEAGRHWLPGTAFGGRETLVTGFRSAEPGHVLRLPTDGWPPFIAAAGTAGFFLLLTVHRVWAAFACGLVAVAAVAWWLWHLDSPPPLPTAQVGDALRLPVAAGGPRSTSWWATIVLLAVDASILASLAFAHVHVSMAADVCPPPGAALPAAYWAIGAGAALVLGSLAMHRARRRVPAGGAWPRSLAVLGATVFAAASLLLALAGHAQAGLAPRGDAWSATVAALLAWQGFHVAVLAVTGGYVVARVLSGRLQPTARATMDNACILWHYVTVQGLAILALVHGLPALLE